MSAVSISYSLGEERCADLFRTPIIPDDHRLPMGEAAATKARSTVSTERSGFCPWPARIPVQETNIEHEIDVRPAELFTETVICVHRIVEK